jgi:hypothetical protein
VCKYYLQQTAKILCGKNERAFLVCGHVFSLILMQLAKDLIIMDLIIMDLSIIESFIPAFWTQWKDQNYYMNHSNYIFEHYHGLSCSIHLGNFFITRQCNFCDKLYTKDPLNVHTA